MLVCVCVFTAQFHQQKQQHTTAEHESMMTDDIDDDDDDDVNVVATYSESKRTWLCSLLFGACVVVPRFQNICVVSCNH